MTFTGNRTNFEHIFGAKVTFYKPINAQGIVATNVNFQNVVTSGTVSISGPTSITSLNVTGITTVTTLNSTTINATSSSTFNDITVNGKIFDGDGNFGSSGQVLSSDGVDTKWINASSASVGSASNVGTNLNETNANQFVTFVGATSGNNAIRVDTNLTYNPATNTMSGISYSGISTFSNIEISGELKDGDGNFGSSGQVLSSDGTDTKWVNASGDLSANDPGGGNVNLRLTDTTGTTDDVLLTAGSNITVSSISAGGFTLSSTDTNTTYTYDAVASGSNVNLRLIGSDGTNDDVLLTAGTGINFSSVSSAGLTINSEGLKDRTTASVTTPSIANDAIANVSLSIPSVSTLLKLQTSAAAWVTLYYNTASRTADANRSIYADPVAGLGVLAEVVTTGAETIGMSPAPILWNNDSTPADTIYAKVVNRSGSTQTITVTATYLQNEK